MVSRQAFPSLLPRAPLAFLSRLKLPFPSLSNVCHAGYEIEIQRPFSKVLELLVYNQLYSFIKKHHTSLDLGKDIPLNKLFLK